MRIAVLTTAVPERLNLLRECCASVRNQTLQPVAHLIGLDYAHEGNIRNLNGLARHADELDCDWLMPLADDDLLYPHHLQTLAEASDSADVVYSWCKVVGRNGWSPNRHFNPDALLDGNYIPATALIRTDLARELGWWREDATHGFEDWDFWKSALKIEARFHCVPEVTWIYRFITGDNISLGGSLAESR